MPISQFSASPPPPPAKAGITGAKFTQSGLAVVTASIDGTVRAFDLTRYRNFRTFTSPEPVQFSTLAIDASGDIVCAGSLDTFEIFVWSMQTGKLLDILTGHEVGWMYARGGEGERGGG